MFFLLSSDNYSLSADDSDDTVPIVVGCVLAGLIAVVMVSYFVLRARAK